MVSQFCPQLQLHIKESQEGRFCTPGLGRMGLDHEAGDEHLWCMVVALSQQELWRPVTTHQAKGLNQVRPLSMVREKTREEKCHQEEQKLQEGPQTRFHTWLSSPRNRSMMKKRQDHNWDKGIIVTALGKAMKASPGPAGHTTQLGGLQTTHYLKRSPLLSTMCTQECVGTSVGVLTCL